MLNEIGLCLLSTDASILWANSGAAELFGYSCEELCQLSLPFAGSSKSPGPTFGRLAGAFQQVLGGEAKELEGFARIRNKEQKRIPVKWKLWRLPHPQHPPQILLALSEPANLSSLLRVKHEQQQEFENTDEAMFRCANDGKSMEVNTALANLLGYGHPDFLRGPVRGVLSRLYVRPQRHAEFLSLLNTQGFVSGFEAEVWRADGSMMWTTVFARTAQGSEGKALYFEGRLMDITARKRAEIALRRSEARFRNLVETTRVIPFEYDPSLKQFSYLGPQAQMLMTPTACSGLSIEDWTSILHPDDVEAGTRLLREPPTNTSDAQVEFRVRGANGQLIWMKQIVHSGEMQEDLEHVRGFFLDVTEAKELEAEREHSQLKLRQLAAHSHDTREQERMIIAREIHDELGQALTLLKIGLSWLGRRLTETVQSEVRQPMEEKIGEMKGMLNSTLETVRRILSALRPPLLDDLGLKAAMEFHVEEFAKRVGIRYDLRIERFTNPPASEATAIFRIFQEILTNIARHAKSSRIVVRVSQSPAEFLLTVEDNGRGISPEDVRELKHFGILGMQERAWAIGGELEIYRRSGGGTRVRLTVPIAPEVPSNLHQPKEWDKTGRERALPNNAGAVLP